MPQVIKVNALTVPADSGDELARRFAARAGAVDGQDGFEGFELLQPTDDRTTWLVLTRWRDEAAFEAWMASASFGAGHGGGRPGGSGGPGGGPGGSGSAGGPGGPPAGAEGAGSGEGEAPARPPVSTQAELWSFVVAGGSDPGAA
jgi:heme-degrading monooxygenase HmoA